MGGSELCEKSPKVLLYFCGFHVVQGYHPTVENSSPKDGISISVWKMYDRSYLCACFFKFLNDLIKDIFYPIVWNFFVFLGITKMFFNFESEIKQIISLRIYCSKVILSVNELISIKPFRPKYLFHLYILGMKYSEVLKVYLKFKLKSL